MYLRLLAVFSIVWIISPFTYGQDGSKIIPASPEANALARFINFPVGYNTGIPAINVPLYEIKAGALRLPITLSYHASGLKVNQRPTNVGLGWSLSTELQITRSVNGADDLKNYPNNNDAGYYYRNAMGPFYENCPDNTCNPIQSGPALLREAQSDIDGQPDRFHFTLLGKSGVFYFQKYGNGIVKAVTIPYTRIKIELVGTNAFKVTDTDGTVYWFGNRNNPSSTAFTELTHNHSTVQESFTTWRCSEIISPSKTDTITFEYASKNEISYNFQERIVLFNNTNPLQCSNPSTSIIYPYSPEMTGNVDFSYISSQYAFYRFSCPKFISYSLGFDAGFHIVWEKYDEEMNMEIEDRLYPSQYLETTNTHVGLKLYRIRFRGGVATFNETDQLNSITITNDRAEEVRTFAFSQSYATNCTDSYTYSGSLDQNVRNAYGSRYLDSVRIKSGSTVLERYAFEYNGKICLKNRKGSDAWGGVNGSQVIKNQNPNMVPWRSQEENHISENSCGNLGQMNISIGAGNVEARESSMKTGVLTKIIYPGGGHTEFNFAANKYKNSANLIKDAGGLRIESIKYFDGTSSVASFEKIYKYGKDENGYGILKLAPNVNSLDGGYKYQQKKYYINPDGWDGNQWNYVHVLADEDMTTYPAASVRDMSFESGSPVHYTEVAEYQKDLGVATGKTVYKYDENVYNGFNPSYILEGTNLTIEAGDWHMGKLKDEIQYRYVNGTYDWVRHRNYQYLPLQKDAQVRVHLAFQQNEYSVGGSMLEQLVSPADFIETTYGIRVGTMLLSQVLEKWKENGRELAKTTNYFYDDISVDNIETENLQPSRITTSTGASRLETTYFYYANDYSPGSLAFADNLRANHMLDLPVEQITTVHDAAGERVIAGQITTYNAVGLPDKMYNLELLTPRPLDQFDKLINGSMDPSYKEKRTYSYDNRSNPVVVTPKDKMPMAYLWDYKKLYPIAEIKNVSNLNDVAYTSFEADGNGGWSGINSANAADYLYVISGNRIYFLDGVGVNPITKTGLNANATYIVTYWSRSSAPYQVNGVSGTVLRTITIGGQNWTCYQHTIVNPAGGTVTLTGQGIIDELRLYPASAQIATYSYDPLIGINTKCDENNRILHYWYDMGRLSMIKDENGNILKRFCYNYAGQPEDCILPSN